MVAEQGHFIDVHFKNLILPVFAAAISCGEYDRIFQQVNALVHLWQWVCILYGQRLKRSVVDKKTVFRLSSEQT